MNFVRYPFFCVNLFFLFFGIAILSLGIMLLTTYSVLEQVLHSSKISGEVGTSSTNFSESVYRSDIPVLLQPAPGPRWLTRIRDPASYLLIGLGSFYFTLSFVGCCGSVKNSRTLMLIYGALLIILFILQCVGGLLYLQYKPDLKMDMRAAINRNYKPEEMQRFTLFEFIFDLLMINYKCCGVNNEKDFQQAYSHLYSVRSLRIDPRSRGKEKSPTSTVLPSQQDMWTKMGQSEMHANNGDTVEARVVTSEEEAAVVEIPQEKERQVPVSCCKLNLTNALATRMLRNIYRRQQDKRVLLDYALDEACVTAPDETNAYVGDSHGCFDKIHGEISTPVRIGLIIIGLVQLCGVVFAGFIFKTAHTDLRSKWHKNVAIN